MVVTVTGCSVVEMKIAVEGCCHGCLDKIYEVITAVQEREGYKIDLLICCGDFQAVRNEEDLCCMAVPPKYRQMETFYKYYSGEKKAPVLTLFIGGNHEASNHLWELSFGGWVAPNIYYLGNAGVVNFGGLRIAGLSGIYKPGDYNFCRYEQPPYDQGTIRSTYHVRSCDVFRLKQLSGQVDIMLSHDWPLGIYHYGNKEELLRIKPYFGDEISRDCLGSPPARDLMEKLKPTFWFSAHLHVKFAAVFRHDNGHTKFLALDKCLPKRQFLQIVDIPVPGDKEVTTPYRLNYDAEWLTILSLTEPLMKYASRERWSTPSPLTHQRWRFTPSEQELDTVLQAFGDLTVPENFVATVTPYVEGAKVNNWAVVSARDNCQTNEFCERLGITNPFRPPTSYEAAEGKNPEEIQLESSDSESESTTNCETSAQQGTIDIVKADDDGSKSNLMGRTEEGVVWGVDKRPGLHLPAPSVPLNAGAEVLEKPDREESKSGDETSKEEIDSDGGCSERFPEHCKEEPKPQSLVIKRRNQAMYAEQDDTTDDN